MLLNHSWDPEYSTSGTPYGAPFSYNPSGVVPRNGQGNPFEGWPFAETFVWTTWDENGNKTTYTSTGAIPFKGIRSMRTRFRGLIHSTWVVCIRAILVPAGRGRSYQDSQRGGNPFAGSSNPFKGNSVRFQFILSNAPTTEEQLQEAKADLRLILSLLPRNLLFWRCHFAERPSNRLVSVHHHLHWPGYLKRLNFLFPCPARAFRHVGSDIHARETQPSE